jgi:hypothetical protein
METFKEKLDDLLDDYKGRIKNPLILSFILVWVYQHWRLLYQFWAIDTKIPFSGRIHLFNIYINENGFCGMILNPLFFAFVSLASFYLIAICGQAIKAFIGKKLAYSVLQKITPSDYVLKSEKSKVEKDLELLKMELVKQKENNKRLTIAETEYNRQLSLEHSLYEGVIKELKEVKSNIAYNIHFKEKIVDSILYLIASNDGDGHENRIYFPDKKQFIQPFLNGSWKIYIYNSIGGNNTESYGLILKDGTIFSRNGQNIGEISDFTMDVKYNIITMCIFLEESKNNNNNLREDGDFYHLLKINNNELIGMRNSNDIVKFERES